METPGQTEAPTKHGPRAPAFDVNVAHPARIYDYWLGGKDNFAADRRAAEEVLAVMPVMAQVARSVRLFLAAVVHYLAADVGIRQFLDIGTGLPTANNTHQVAQRAAPESRIVYVDNDRCKSGCAHALGRSGCLRRTRAREALRASLSALQSACRLVPTT
jgi:hypothetical protein